MPPIPATEAKVLIAVEDDDDRFLPEGPRPIRVSGRDAIIWVNIQTAPDAVRGAIHLRFWDDGEEALWNLSGRPGFVLPTTQENVVFVGMGKQLGTLHLETNEFRELATIPDTNPRTILNDAEVLPGGKAIVFGTKDVKFADPVAHLYLYALTDGKISVLADRQTCSNGKVFTRGDRGLILYDIDTPTRKVVRYQMEVGGRTAIPDGVAIDLAEYPGFPDGMCGCGDGTAVIAFYDPSPSPHGRAIRFDLVTGKPVSEYLVPGSPRVTCPCLVRRPESIQLVLTTATEGMSPEDRQKCPNAGFLFIANAGLSDYSEPEVVRLED